MNIFMFFSYCFAEYFKKNNLEIYDIENIKVHGGSNRYYIKKKKIIKLNLQSRFKRNMILERKNGLHKFSSYKKFSKKVKESKLTSSD